MKFELLEQLQQEDQSQKEEINRKKSVFEAEEKKLAELQGQINGMILNGESETALDALYDEISKQETITERRKSEYQLVKERFESTNFNGKEVYTAFNQFKNEYEQANIQPIYEKLEQIKQNYFEVFGNLETAIRTFNVEADQVVTQLNRIRKITGGDIYSASPLSVNYDGMDIKVPRSKGVW